MEIYVPAYESSIVLQFPTHLSTQTENWGSLEFILMSVGLAWHGWLFKDSQFQYPLELEASDPS